MPLYSRGQISDLVGSVPCIHHKLVKVCPLTVREINYNHATSQQKPLPGVVVGGVDSPAPKHRVAVVGGAAYAGPE